MTRNGQVRYLLQTSLKTVANSSLKSPDEFSGESKYQLDVYCCKICSPVQLLDVISPEILFRDYIYVTGTSETLAWPQLNHSDSTIQFLL